MAHSDNTFAYYFGMGDRAIGTFDYFDRFDAFPVLSYVRSGYIDTDYDALEYAGIGAYDWTSLARLEVNTAYLLGMYDRDVDPSNHVGRSGAFPVKLNKDSILSSIILCAERVCLSIL